MTRLIAPLLVTLLGLACFAGYADEQTGREFSELVRELNKELADAKIEVRKLEAERQATVKTDTSKTLPQREKALKELRKNTEDLKKAKSVEEKKVMEAKVQDQVIRVAELSADFLEGHKSELVNQDKQLAVIENALAKVIIKLDRLTAIAAKDKDPATKQQIENQKVTARRELQSMARMVEMLAKSNPKARHWNSVRQTIMLQDAVLQRSIAGSTKLHKMLEAQKHVYEQTHAQIVLARRSIAEERQLLAQVALGEVARSMLRKAAGLLLGSHSVENIGTATIAKVDMRKKSLLKFLDQDQEVDRAFDLPNGGYAGNTPDGYDDYLKKTIN